MAAGRSRPGGAGLCARLRHERRNPNYHGPGDVMDRLDLTAMTELTLGLVNFIEAGGR